MAIPASVHVSCWLSKEKRMDTSCHCGRKRTPTMCHEVRSLTPTMCSNSTLLIPCHAPSTYTTYEKSCVPMFNPIVRRPTWQIRRCTVHAGTVACFKLFYTRPIHMKVVSTARRREIEEEEHECRKGKRKNGARQNCGLPSIDCTGPQPSSRFQSVNFDMNFDLNFQQMLKIHNKSQNKIHIKCHDTIHV